MSYIIRKTDGSILLTLADETVDVISTSISLLGKNISNYGEYYNNSLIGLLENFASTQQPNAPLIGQLWYDESDGIMKVYSVNGLFERIVPPINNPATPQDSKVGDLWVDTTNDQLKFRSTDASFMLAAPIYTKNQGKSGFVMKTVLDRNTDSHDVSVMYSNNQIVGVLYHQAFNTLDPNELGGITTVLPGITLNNTLASTVRFFGEATSAVTATSAENFSGSVNIDNLPAVFLTNFSNRTGAMDYTTGTLRILNDDGLKVGTNENIVLSATGSETPTVISNLIHNIVDRPLRIQGRNTAVGYYTSVYMDSNTKRVGILTETPQTALDVNGDTTINGDLLIPGVSDYLITNAIRVASNNIELNYDSGGVNDTMAEGGGIVLHGTTDHTITWTESFDGSWEINNNLNLSDLSSSYKINGQVVLSNSTLGLVVTNAPGLTDVGVLNQLTVTNISITTGTISTIGVDVDLVLNPAGAGAVDVNNSKITNVNACTDSLDAANKQYVDNSLYQFRSRFSFTIDETNMGDPPVDIISYLDRMFPITNIFPYESLNIPTGSTARILCSTVVVTMPLTALASTSRNTITVDKNGVYSSESVLADIAFSIPETAVTFVTTYVVRQFEVVGGVWSYIGVVV